MNHKITLEARVALGIPSVREFFLHNGGKQIAGLITSVINGNGFRGLAGAREVQRRGEMHRYISRGHEVYDPHLYRNMGSDEIYAEIPRPHGFGQYTIVLHEKVAGYKGEIEKRLEKAGWNVT